jgi:hypothetical protein
MNPIKFVILSFLSVAVWAFETGSSRASAGARLLALVLSAAAIVSVLQPSITQEVANVLGVTRGTDLILYGFIVVLVLTSVGTYFRFREHEQRIAKLVRANAIRDAILSQGMPGKGRVVGRDDDR